MTDDDLMVAADALEQRGDLAAAARLRLRIPPATLAGGYAAIAAALATGSETREAIAFATAAVARSPHRALGELLAFHGVAIARDPATARVAYAADRTGKLAVYATPAMTELGSVDDPPEESHTRLGCSPDGQYLVSCCDDGLRIWDAGEVPALRHAHAGLADLRSFAIVGGRVVAWAREGFACAIDLATGARAWRRATAIDAACAIGDRLACTDADRVFALDPATGAASPPIVVHTDNVRTIVTAGDRFATASSDAVVVWDARAFAPIGRWQARDARWIAFFDRDHLALADSHGELYILAIA